MLIQNTGNTAAAPTAPAGNSGTPSGAAAQAPRVAAIQAPRVAAIEPPVEPSVAQQQISHAQLVEEIGKINSALQRGNKAVELSISTDESTKKQVVKLTDKDSGETLIQYPSDAVLAIARGIDEFQQGMLLKQQA